MALLRNRPVSVIGPNGAPEVSPIYTVQYPDGTREDTPLKFIQMSESEHKEWAKNNKQHADIVRTVPDKEHQDIVDSQDVKKIQDKRKSGKVDGDQAFVPAKTFVKQSDVNQAAPQAEKPLATQTPVVTNKPAVR